MIIKEETEHSLLVKTIESTLISVASSIPIASSVAAGWTEYRNYVQERNIKEIIENFLKKLEELEDSIDRQFLQSMELKSLVIKTCFVGKEELIEEKRKYLSLFLANQCLKKNANDASRWAILETITKLNPIDVKLMSLMPFTQGDPLSETYSFVYEKKLHDHIGVDDEQSTKISLYYLISLGVVQTYLSTISNNSISRSIVCHELEKKRKELSLYDDNKKKINHFANRKDELLCKIKELEDEYFEYDKNRGNISQMFALTMLGHKVLESIAN